MKRWKPVYVRAREFAEKMDEIQRFCEEHGIDCSASMDSFYFEINGQKYRVSDYTVAQSNRGAYDDVHGKKRELYHPEGERDDTVYITASKTRIVDIYEALADGKTLDRRGRVIYG